MGQQQLLLLVFGITVVGVAVLVGINAFEQNQKRTNRGAFIDEGLRLASDLRAWSAKSEAFGGGGGDFASAEVRDAAGLMRAVFGKARTEGAAYRTAWGTATLDLGATPHPTLTLLGRKGQAHGTVSVPPRGRSRWTAPAE